MSFSDNEEDETDLLLLLLDHITNILNWTAVWKSNNIKDEKPSSDGRNPCREDVRLELTSKLNSFGRQMLLLYESEDDAGTTYTDLLLTIEESCAELRNVLSRYERSLDAELSQFLKSWHDMQELLDKTHRHVGQDLKFTMHQFVHDYRFSTVRIERKRLKILDQQLDMIYVNPNQQTMMQHEIWNFPSRWQLSDRWNKKMVKLVESNFLKENSEGNKIPDNSFVREEEAPTIISSRELISRSSNDRIGILDTFEQHHGGHVRHIVDFLLQKQRQTEDSRNIDHTDARSVLIQGSSGSGKSYLLGELESYFFVHHLVEVVHPTITDFLGGRVGDAERAMVSIMRYASSRPKGVAMPGKIRLLLLDDLDELLELSERLMATFLTLWDQLKHHVMLVATTSLDDAWMEQVVGSRFDKVYYLDVPGDSDREHMLQGFLRGNENTHFRGDLDSPLIDDLVSLTKGTSRAELSQAYRQAVSRRIIQTLPDQEHLSQVNHLPQLVVMQDMKASFRSWMPASLQSAVIADFCDMRVWSEQDLMSSTEHQSLLGSELSEIMESAKDCILTPLCRSKELDELMGVRKESAKIVCGGLLLTGKPGTGKSALAFHLARECCRFMASTSSSGFHLLEVSCTSLIRKEVGGSERSIHRLFQTVRSAAPCIVLLDGIENIAQLRGHDTTTEGTMDRVLSTLLTELDGVDNRHHKTHNVNRRVAVLGITPDASWIDPAVKRPGRLDKTLNFPLPGPETRRLILEKEMGEIDLRWHPNLMERLVEGTAGKSIADISSIFQRARFECARHFLSEVGTVTPNDAQKLWESHGAHLLDELIT